jgi:predicted RNA-binding Zn ribbon-like protein
MSDPLAVQFVNAREWRRPATPGDSAAPYRRLVDWARKAEIFGHAEADRLARESESRPSDADAAWRRASRLREAMYRLFSARAEARSPDHSDLEILNESLGESAVRRRLRTSDEGLCWTWAEAPDCGLDWMLWPVAYSAAELLTGPEADRVKTCPAEGCGWIFVDQSRNRSRRWCDMQSCGNREKARRHYHRGRARTETSAPDAS